MKKVVLATFLACGVAICLPLASAQDAAPAAPAAPADPCAVPPMATAEYAVYNNAMTQTDPKAQAAGLEQYLTQFPQSAVKADVLSRLVALYNGTNDLTKELDAADRLLQVDPNNLYGLVAESALRMPADSVTDAAAKQTALDAAAGYAQRGLTATKGKCQQQADFDKLKATFDSTFYHVVGTAAFNKNDYTTAIDNFKKELAAVPVDQTKAPGPVLLDTFYLAEAYVHATPSDYLDCTFYASRVIAYAPDAFKQQSAVAALPKYCYHKYHGPDDDGFDKVTAAATANLNPPDGLFAGIKPAPTPADIVNQVIATTPDLSGLATGDKEYILQNGTPDQASKMWDLMKGKSYQFPDVLVIASTPTQIQAAVSQDSIQNKTADFTFTMTPLNVPDEPKASATPAAKAAYKKAKAEADAITAATAPGQTVTLSGTFDSYTPTPFMINLTDGAVVLPKATPAKPAAHAPAHPAAKKPAAH